MRATLFIRGRVQGVGYRNFVHQNAQNFRLKGAVRNLGNGGVEVFVEGDEQEIERFVEFLKKKKPSAANIEAVEMFPEKNEKYKGPWRDMKYGFFIDWHSGD